jgi:hypothetical protein
MACKQVIRETMVPPESVPGTWVTLPEAVKQAFITHAMGTNVNIYPKHFWTVDIVKGYVDDGGEYWAVLSESGAPLEDGESIAKQSVYHCVASTPAPGPTTSNTGELLVSAVVGGTVVAGMLYWALKK